LLLKPVVYAVTTELCTR